MQSLFVWVMASCTATRKIFESFSWHIALATGYKRHDAQGYLRHHLLPLWWYSNRSGETNLHLPFLLATFQSSADGNRVFRAILLGLLYYQNSDYAAYDQTLGVAIGTSITTTNMPNGVLIRMAASMVFYGATKPKTTISACRS